MRLTIYTSENILRCLLTDIKFSERERKYPVWVSFINKTTPDIKYRPDPLINQEGKDQVTTKDLIRSCTLQSPNLSINPMTGKEITLTCQIECNQLEYVKSLKLNTSILKPRSIVILDIDPDIARIISKRNGIICHSFSTPAAESPMFYEGRDIYFTKDIKRNFSFDYQSKFGLDRLMSEYPIKPVNSVVMIDRYLCRFGGFQDGCKGDCKTCQIDKLECNRTTIKDGWDNIANILDQILPEYLNQDFHVLLIYEVLDSKKAENSNSEQALKNFEKWTKSFTNYIKNQIYELRIQNHHPLLYNVVIEVMSLTYWNKEYKKIDKISCHSQTHNRRIFSNYFVIRAEHSLKIQRSSKILYTQYVSLDWVASKGVISNIDSDLPEECISDCIKTVMTLIKNNRDKHILFSQNGEMKPIDYIVNRLVKS